MDKLSEFCFDIYTDTGCSKYNYYVFVYLFILF